MGRELQKKKRRSNRQPVRQSNRTKKILNPRGNSVIAQNWDKKATLAQNYQRLGLLARLKAPTGGTEKKLGARLGASKDDPFAIASVGRAVVSEAKVERDADGRIVRILGTADAKPNPLGDPLNGPDSGSDSGDEWGGIAEREAREDDGTTDVVKALIEESHNPAPRVARHQSDAEREWLGRLVAKHGSDTGAMARDLKLNPMQQTARDIARRLRKLQGA
ncbi:uncharacterized protein UV8b_06876 [Ustilaginoidea virens]|uniref:Nucleolar protein 16 n=1 Tax=Ustilaginoidea virens TaxID=1159556 RepID=A0A063CC34_USTVR|nr:uncharacterized protein UV8b_06876 [Ustilaginoidea virens]QUC22635.1 hypothetical protein UV8b_06876 [Ustilaginoidea virens]GAO16863.1 hypothetical protein UVI_02011840 [Ustilaginoidea virens]